MFETERFVEACYGALKEDNAQSALRDVVTKTLEDRSGIIKRLGEPRTGGLGVLYQADDLTVLNVVWPPYMTVPAHNHNMAAVIGVYTGGEDNIFWRRDGNRIEAAGAEALREGQAASLGTNIIHSVTNPLPKFTGAIHVYSGDFFAKERQQWASDTLEEGPYDADYVRQLFAESNERHYATQNTAD